MYKNNQFNINKNNDISLFYKILIMSIFGFVFNYMMVLGSMDKLNFYPQNGFMVFEHFSSLLLFYIMNLLTFTLNILFYGVFYFLSKKCRIF